MDTTRAYASTMPARGSQCRETAVDGYQLTGDVTRVVAQQEHDRCCDLPRGSLATDRYRRSTAARSTRGRPAAERRVDQARRDDVRAHALARALERDVATEAGERSLRGVVRGNTGARTQTR